MMCKCDLKSMNERELCEVAVSLGEKPFRGKQLYNHIARGEHCFGDMQNIPEAFLHKLEKEYYIEKPEIIKLEKSKKDGTQKYAFKLKDDLIIESVLMKYSYGNSICISSQAGCAMGCVFCASGASGFERNLTAGEMLAEVDQVARNIGERISRIVIMGTGEPMQNLKNINTFIELMHDAKGRNMSLRNITVSSCGLIPELKKFYKRWPQVNLAISLHSHDSEIRQRLMPIEKTYPIEEIFNFAKEYTGYTNRRITYEYALIKGINDGTGQAKMLASKLKGQLCHVNLIILNDSDGYEFKGTDHESATAFMNVLKNRGIQVTMRRKLGDDISGACGQLRLRLSGENCNGSGL